MCFAHHPYPENIFWVIEYSNSSLTKDLEIKSKTYAKVSIPEYWVINLKRMELVVFRDASDEDYREKRTLIDGEINPLAFAEVFIAVNRLLRRFGLLSNPNRVNNLDPYCVAGDI